MTLEGRGSSGFVVRRKVPVVRVMVLVLILLPAGVRLVFFPCIEVSGGRCSPGRPRGGPCMPGLLLPWPLPPYGFGLPWPSSCRLSFLPALVSWVVGRMPFATEGEVGRAASRAHPGPPSVGPTTTLPLVPGGVLPVGVSAQHGGWLSFGVSWLGLPTG